MTIQPGDTVVLKRPEGVFLRREFHFGVVAAVEGQAIEVLWDNGRSCFLHGAGALEKVRAEKVSEKLAALLGRHVRSPNGIVVNVYGDLEGKDWAVVETAVGLLHVLPAADLEVVATR